jgi:triosephosphate isomerase
MRRPIIVGNWKMNLLISEAEQLASEVIESIGKNSQAEVVLAPPFTALGRLHELLDGTGIKLAAQNAASERSGAYTGEISGEMLKNAGCHYVILGHSERRQLYNEDDATINRKVRLALDAGLEVILCVGETRDERQRGDAHQVIEGQLQRGLQGVSVEEMGKTVIAYEPVWAIGTGKNASALQAQKIHAHGRNVLAQLYGENVADQVRIQYGGSVSPENAREILAQKDVDGALVGTSSLKSVPFCAIINKIV